ncbi:hypothetical protein [Sporolactobacillus laevolacticus]|uniref:Uncharacterized protein n=1 Tax=Sporolactobacillus laevolacticus DSM 442 TaxID=1395513 RepID=V6IZP2_9BACL|nr:hypothetical protein [Sporolactobacillus laevolacticus]EST12970.1 hypothetical protein P343_04380 [Sporolactobacillus laevolacticus DSM 442]
MNLWMLLGIFLLICGLVLLSQRKKAALPHFIARRINSLNRFFTTLSIMLILAGIASMLATTLTGMMGFDFWILYYLGIFACLMLLFLFLLH